MQAIFANKKDSFSTWLLILFSVTLLLTAAYSKYFHIPGAKDHNLERIRILFNESDLKNVQKLELKNRLGTFKTEKATSEKMGQYWLLTSPRRLLANTKTISNILEILQEVRIKKVYPKDPINLANFSLNSPNIELVLSDSSGVNLTVSIGLINPIDNSTYLLSSDSDAIFHIQALPSLIEKLNFSDFVDSNISNTKFEKISSIRIYKRDVRNAQLDLHSDKQGKWKSREGRLVATDSVKAFYEKLISTQSHMILDVTTQEQKDSIKEILKKPLYKFKVTENKKNRVTYKISSLIVKIPGVKLERRKYVLIQSSNKDYPSLYNKSILKNFYKTQYSFKRRKN